LRDAVALAVAERTTCRFDEEVKGAIVRVRTADGQTHQAKIERPLGHKSRPVPREKLVEKFHDCCSHAAQSMTPEAVRNLVAMLDDLAGLDDVRRIVASLAT